MARTQPDPLARQAASSPPSLLANARADGYTLLFSAGSIFALNPILFAVLPRSAVKSFTPISFVFRSHSWSRPA